MLTKFILFLGGKTQESKKQKAEGKRSLVPYKISKSIKKRSTYIWSRIKLSETRSNSLCLLCCNWQGVLGYLQPFTAGELNSNLFIPHSK